MQRDLLKNLLAVPSYTFHEDQMVGFIMDHVNRRGVARCGRATVDEHNNVYIVKGNARFVPCVAAHTDTVQRWSEVQIVQQDGTLVGFDAFGRRIGTGGDDKAGICVSLELIERFENIAAAFFAAEEVGCIGARNARADFFERVGYVVEFDCPAHGLVSYRSGGERLFRNDGEFIKRALPILRRHDSMHWQNHPFSDVKALRRRFTFECMNLSAGYHHWHSDSEYVNLTEIAAAVELGEELVATLGTNRYAWAAGEPEAAEPPVTITELRLPVKSARSTKDLWLQD